MIYNMCNMVDSVILLIVRKRVSWHAQVNSWYQSVCQVSLTVFIYSYYHQREREDSLSGIRVFHSKLCPSEYKCMMSCLSSNFEALVQLVLLLLGRAQRVWEIQNDDARIFHPFPSYCTPAHTHRERERWKERQWIIGEDSVPLEKEQNRKIAL